MKITKRINCEVTFGELKVLDIFLSSLGQYFIKISRDESLNFNSILLDSKEEYFFNYEDTFTKVESELILG